MKVTETRIPEVKLIEPTVFEDERGCFFESFNLAKFQEAIGYSASFVQDNHSRSVKGVVRGLHYQLAPHAQGKLVRVVQGEVFDVAVDLRRSSPTFGEWVGVILSAENKRQLWIPEGFAHGFMTLSACAEFVYKVTDYYAADCECSVRWDDPLINIIWPEGTSPVLSAKDTLAVDLEHAEVFA